MSNAKVLESFQRKYSQTRLNLKKLLMKMTESASPLVIKTSLFHHFSMEIIKFIINKHI